MIPEEDLICDECKLNPPSFRRGISCWLHRGVGRDIILSLKYRNADFLRDDLANLIKSLRREVSEFASDSLLVPVPMHYFRRIRRGYNQSDVIAEAIAKITNGSTIVNMLKSKHKKSQTQLGREERLTNVRGAFECTSAADSVEKNSRIVLVDDVFTTGATARECCLALQSAGFTNLYVLTLAIG